MCAELNTLYNWLLYSLGFQVTSYNARMLLPDTYLFRRHRILAVRLRVGHIPQTWASPRRMPVCPFCWRKGWCSGTGTAPIGISKRNFTAGFSASAAGA